MQTIQQYAEQVAASDRGRWREATLRAAELVGHHRPTIDLTSRLPLTQILLQTTTLIIYAIAAADGRHPDEVSPLVSANWAAERMLPLAPHPDGPTTDAEWVDADRRWRRDLDRAVERIRQDMARLLRRAGHVIPDPDVRSLERYSDDPVVMTWIDLADVDPPESRSRYGVFEQFPVPRLALGVTALHDLSDDDYDDCFLPD